MSQSRTEVPFNLPWWTKAWNWFRKWGWVPVGFVLLLLGFLCGGAIFGRRREDGRRATPVDNIKDAIDRNNEEIDAEIEQARQEHIADIVRVEREHQAAIDELNEEQEQKRQELRRNPKKLAKWLTDLSS